MEDLMDLDDILIRAKALIAQRETLDELSPEVGDGLIVQAAAVAA